MTDTTQPPAETLALTPAQLDSVIGALHFVLAGEYDRDSHPHGEDVMQRALDKLTALKGRTIRAAALTRRAGGDAGWIVSNADGTLWRTWQAGSPAWVGDRAQATPQALDGERMMTLEQYDALKVGDLVIVSNRLSHGHMLARIEREPGAKTFDASTWRTGLRDWSEVTRRDMSTIICKVEGTDAEAVGRALFEAGCRLRDAQNAAAGKYMADVAMIARTGGAAA